MSESYAWTDSSDLFICLLIHNALLMTDNDFSDAGLIHLATSVRDNTKSAITKMEFSLEDGFQEATLKEVASVVQLSVDRQNDEL